jgi:hypothetical protein
VAVVVDQALRGSMSIGDALFRQAAAINADLDGHGRVWSFPIARFHFGRSNATDPDLGATPDPDVTLKSDYIRTSPDDCPARRGRSTRSKYFGASKANSSRMSFMDEGT